MTNSADSVMEQRHPTPIPETEESYAKPVFEPIYYVAHLLMIVYILAGIALQVYQYATHKTFRLLSVATWPWVLTGSSWVLLLAVIVYGAALYVIARQVKGKLEEMEISWYTLSPYILFGFVWFAMLGRLLVYYISPEGVFFNNFIQGN